jgi:hypothetical protein
LKIAIFGTTDHNFILQTFRDHPTRGFEAVAFADPFRAKQNEISDYSDGLPLWSLETLREKYPRDIQGVFFNTRWAGAGWGGGFEFEALRLYDLGIRNIFIPYPRNIELRENFLDGASNGKFAPEFVYTPDWIKPFIFRLETHITDHCNLNCKSCNNFSSLEPCSNFHSPEQYDHDLARLRKLFGNVCILGLQGGEPLLDPPLTLEFARIARKHFPYSDIRVHTNGLLIPKIDDAIFTGLRKLNITTQISVYLPTEKMMDEIKLRLDNFGCDYWMFGNRGEFAQYLTEFPFEDAAWNKEHCGSIGCHYLCDGKLYKCPETELVRNFDAKFGTHIHRSAGVDIHANNDAWEISRTLNHTSYLCSYCAKRYAVKNKWSNDKDLVREDWLIPHRYEREKQADIAKIAKLTAISNEYQLTIQRLESESNKYCGQIKQLQSDSAEQLAVIKQLCAAETSYKNDIAELKNQNIELVSDIKALSTELSTKVAEVSEFQRVVAARDIEIERLNHELTGAKTNLKCTHQRLAAIENSTSWKATKPLRTTVDMLRKILKWG